MQMGAIDKDRLVAMMREVDTDGDGSINYGKCRGVRAVNPGRMRADDVVLVYACLCRRVFDGDNRKAAGAPPKQYLVGVLRVRQGCGAL